MVQVRGAQRILDIGTGFGYSALWLASAAGGEATVDAVDRFGEHLAEATRFAEGAGLASRIRFLEGEAEDVVPSLLGPYDLVHDDGWFARAPLYLDAVVERLSPRGVITMPNWFLLEDVLSGLPRRDWSEFAGPNWAAHTVAYAERLAAHPGLDVTWCLDPPLALAVRR